MIFRRVDTKRWRIVFLFDKERSDIEGVLSLLMDYGAPIDVINSAEDMLYSDELNCGFTYSNTQRRICLVWIGPQKNGREWVNTIVHEIFHITMAIAKEKGMFLQGEEPAYLCGEIIREISDIVCHLGCDRCR